MGLSRYDDLAGETVPAKTITLSVDEKTWTVDLGEANLSALLEALRPFTDAGQEVTDAPKKAPAKKATGTQKKRQERTWPAYDQEEVRAWALAQKDLTVKEKGRLSAPVLEAWFQAQGPKAA